MSSNERKTRKRGRILAVLFCLSLMLSVTGCKWIGDKVDAVLGDRNGNGALSASGLAADRVGKFLADGAVREKKVKLKGDGTDTVTVLIYMNGSNLESDDNEATTDLSEIVAAGSSDKVNILVETLGTKKWNKKYGIASDRSQIYKVEGKGLKLVKDDLGQLDCTAEESLRDFIIWGVQNYPADRYILQFWDHGGGPVYGFGYDEWVKDEDAALTIDEMQRALKDAGVYFDFVGMDCCLMSCLEVCCAFYDYCDYMILSEDFESGLGWSYTNWVKALYQNPSIPTVELGKKICDDMVSANETDRDGDRSIMAIIDQSMLKVLYTAWTDFALENENALLGKNYSRSVKRRVGGRVLPALAQKARPNGWNWDFFGYGDSDDADETSMAEYFVTDIMEVAGSVKSEKSAALSAAINATLIYVKSTASDAGLTGIAVSLPYGDSEYYNTMKQIFLNIGLDSTYVNWLGKFVGASGTSNTYDHDSWDDSWSGWDDYEDDYDWDDWDYSDDSYGSSWWDIFGWDDWDYEDSWNEWYEDDYWDDDHGWNCKDDDWYYGDDYWYDDDWYGDGSWDNDHSWFDSWDDDDWYDDDWDDREWDDWDEDDDDDWWWFW